MMLFARDAVTPSQSGRASDARLLRCHLVLAVEGNLKQYEDDAAVSPELQLQLGGTLLLLLTSQRKAMPSVNHFL